MLRVMIILALSFAAPAAHAAAIDPTVLEFDGQRFEYYMKLDEDVIKIDGILVDNGDGFSLTVRPSGRVTGHFGGNAVDYSVKKSVRDQLAARLKREKAIALSDASIR